MHGVVACLAEDNAVVHRVRSAELDVNDMMSSRAFSILVPFTTFLAEAENAGPTAGTPAPLAGKRLLLCQSGELIGSRRMKLPHNWSSAKAVKKTPASQSATSRALLSLRSAFTRSVPNRKSPAKREAHRTIVRSRKRIHNGLCFLVGIVQELLMCLE
jgi:hypothetical protein